MADSPGVSTEVSHEEEAELLGEGCSKQNKTVAIPRSEWDEMKATQQQLLEFIGSMNKIKSGKRTHTEMTAEIDESSHGDGDDPEGDRSEGDAPKKKKAKVDDDDFDSDIQEIIRASAKSSEAQSVSDTFSDTLKEIEQDYTTEEKVGPALKNEALTKALNKMTKGKLEDEKLKEKMEKHNRPENFNISVPKVNQEIWNSLEFNSRISDLRVQKQQKMLTKAAGILAKVCDKIIGSDNEMLKDTADAMALILHASHEMSMDRRTKILSGPNISQKYKKLGSSEVPITEQLFGDDLNASLRNIESASKLGREFSQSKLGRKFFPVQQSKNFIWNERGRGRGQNWGRGRASVMMRGRGQFRPRGRAMQSKFHPFA